MSPSLAVAALLSLPFLGHPADVHRGHQRIGAWTLTVAKARFSGETTCSLAAKGVRFERQAVVVRLAAGADTTNAVYRVDGGTPVEAKTDSMELARLGFQLYDDDLSNPSGGLVRIPLRRLESAHRVSVQVKPGAPVAAFRLDGLNAAVRVARAAGCADSAFR
jgi:hypothetical protein